MSTQGRTLQSTAQRLDTVAKWLQTGSLGSFKSDAAALKECVELAGVLEKEHDTWESIILTAGRYGGAARLRAMAAMLATCAHKDAATLLRDTQAVCLYFQATRWANTLLTTPGASPPNSTQQSVGRALLRTRVLHGCCRQLAGLADPVASAPANREQATDPPNPILVDAMRFKAVNCAANLVAVLVFHGTRYLPQPGDSAVVQGGCGAIVGAADQEEPSPCSWVLELVSCVSSSAVLEHAARAVLRLAGWLQRRATGAGGGLGPLWAVNVTEVHRAAKKVSTAFFNLSNMTHCAVLLDGEDTAAVDGDHESAETVDIVCTAPLLAQPYELDAAHVSLLRCALSGPCVRHLVLCTGLRALCALDGGGDYGLTQVPGAQWLPPELPGVVQTNQHQQQEHQVGMGSLFELLNLLTLLAMSPCDPDAEPPGRDTRLQLTMRVARVAMAVAACRTRPAVAGSGGGGGGDGDGDDDGDLQCSAALVAVQALHFAWRHMPPPEDQDDGRRSEAVGEWAALLGEVAGSGLVTGAEVQERVAYRMGLMLGLHSDLVGPHYTGGAFLACGPSAFLCVLGRHARRAACNVRRCAHAGSTCTLVAGCLVRVYGVAHVYSRCAACACCPAP